MQLAYENKMTLYDNLSYMVCFSRSIEQRKQFYNCEVNRLGVV